MHQLRKNLLCLCALAVTTFLVGGAYASQLTIPLYLTAEQGTKLIGNVSAEDTPYGLLLTPNLKGLPPGIHGFHVHEMPSCHAMGMAAGGHLDPQHTGKHLGPYNNQGHLGDLPALTVNKEGEATLPVLAPRLKTQQLKGHALMIHVGGDNYSDLPAKLGGGGARLACGVF
jgi:Cu-Zn family superoxide dismutase